MNQKYQCKEYISNFSTEKHVNLFFALLILLLGTLVRIYIVHAVQIYSWDICCFLRWAIGSAKNFTALYSMDSFIDYPPAYIYVLAVIGKLILFFKLSCTGSGCLLLLKTPAIIADIVCSYIIFKLARKNLGYDISLVLTSLYVFNPAVIFDSCIWGQIDSVFTLLLLLWIYFLHDDRIPISSVFFTLAVLTKPQAFIFTPIFIFEFIRRKDLHAFLKSTVYSLITALIIVLPFALHEGAGWIFKLYISTLGEYNFASVNAPNLFWLTGGNCKPYTDDFFIISYKTAGTAFLVLTVFFVAFLYLKGKSCNVYLFGSLTLMLATFTLSTKMHERYIFPAIILALICYIYMKDKRFLLIFGAISLSAFGGMLDIYSGIVQNTFTINIPSIGDLDIMFTLCAILNLLSLIYLAYISVRICIYENKLST